MKAFTPQVIFRKEFRRPDGKTAAMLRMESDYPREVFGAPRHYVAYVERRGKLRPLGSAKIDWSDPSESLSRLAAQIRRWQDNEKFWEHFTIELRSLLMFCKRSERQGGQ